MNYSYENLLGKLPWHKTLDLLAPEPLWHAVGIVNLQYQREGKQPGRECWTNDTRRWSPELIADVQQEWRTLTGKEGAEHPFPWHDDLIRLLWVQFRKMDRQDKAAFFEYYGIAGQFDSTR